MCVYGITGRNTSTLTCTQRTMNAWSQVQACRRESIQGYRSVSYSNNTTLDQELNVNPSGKTGAQIPQLPLGDNSSPWGDNTVCT
jgi:hypothetical protein